MASISKPPVTVDGDVRRGIRMPLCWTVTDGLGLILQCVVLVGKESVLMISGCEIYDFDTML